ncbi:UpxY family transcription antiterminator [Edaphobacter sp. HDX4]|uniref:transcription termination/antitermination protein NusG n=1 Tax=Edaphobacter sp. HDX4 TaxID=2794064 RepID=UPI002FE5FBBB
MSQKDSTATTDLEPHWYAVYTLPRHEKSIADHLVRQGLETYLPLYASTRKWNHRIVQLDLPLFPGYVLVKIVITERARVLSHPGVIRLVGFNGIATALPDGEVERLRSVLSVWKAEPYSFFAAGKQIRVTSGPFANFEGRIIRRKGKMRLVVSLQLIQQAIVLEMDAAEAQLARPLTLVDNPGRSAAL